MIIPDQISPQEIAVILRELSAALMADGDVVELGCYAGQTSVELAKTLRDFSAKFAGKKTDENANKNSDEKKKLWLYDSFKGLPEKSAKDISVLGADFKTGELFVAKADVVRRFKSANLPMPNIKKAWFSNLTTNDLPEKICFAFLDGDYYESIRDSFKLIEKKMTDGSVIIVDDYDNDALPGAKKAVDEWLAKNPENKLRVVQSLAIIKV